MNTDILKKFVAPVLVIAFVYFFVVPIIVWGAPDVEAFIPTEAALGQDIDIKITVHSMHPMYNVHNVRFYVDIQNSTATDTENPFYAVVVFSEPAERFSAFKRLKRFTFPQSKTMYVRAPLAKAKEDGVLREGVLVGKVDVEFTYARANPKHPARDGMASIPFQINIK